MKGWQTKTFLEKQFIHHRRMGTGKKSLLAARFNYGQKDYYLGGHPLWEMFRVIYQMKYKPFIIGGLILGIGYLYQCIFHNKRPIHSDLVKFNQKEQLSRLKKLIKKRQNRL